RPQAGAPAAAAVRGAVGVGGPRGLPAAARARRPVGGALGVRAAQLHPASGPPGLPARPGEDRRAAAPDGPRRLRGGGPGLTGAAAGSRPEPPRPDRAPPRRDERYGVPTLYGR